MLSHPERPSRTAITDYQGGFLFPCLSDGKYKLEITADGFQKDRRAIALKAGQHYEIAVSLRIPVHIDVLAVDDASQSDSGGGSGSVVLKEKQIEMLADDPDDLERELQALAAAAGGTPGQATITLDGFSSPSKLPPKSSIGEIQINPDLFSAEYETPPYQGGHIDVITKPGQSKFHGSVFFSYGGLDLNARDPLSQTLVPASRERYGGDLSGPLLRPQNDFSLHFEHRVIDDSRVVTAFVPNADNVFVPFSQSVPVRQSVSAGSARAGWKLSAADTFVALFTVRATTSNNDGVGGVVLPEAGFRTSTDQYALRLSNTDAISPRLLHQTRLLLSESNLTQIPNSTSPSLQVEGAFTGGGAATQFEGRREANLDFEDTVISKIRAHSLKAGIILLGKTIHDRSDASYNGIFDFGGGFAPDVDANGTPIPGTLTFISGLEQYRRALLGLSGGTPTIFTVKTGDPFVELAQWRLAAFVQDQWRLKQVALSLGLRYTAQTERTSLNDWAPRLGIAWSPGHTHRVTLRARTGLFYQPIDANIALQTLQLNGKSQTETLLYSPLFSNTPNPATAIAVVENVREFAPNVHPSQAVETQVGAEGNLPGHWKAEVSAYWTWGRDLLRSVNLNSPIVTDGGSINPVLDPRPLVPGENIFQYQSSGSLQGPVIFVGLNQFSSKRYSLLLGYLHFGMTTNADTPNQFPQSSVTQAGETARPSWEASNRLFGVAQLYLPAGLVVGTNFEAATGLPYNITTGFDNNGDGIVNDRPSFGDPGATEAIQTKFGFLTPVATNGNVPRNLGTMPSTIHVDLSLNRRFALHPRNTEASTAITLTGRVSNLLNHTNVTAVSGILESPDFGQPIAADFARRVEIGLRYSF